MLKFAACVDFALQYCERDSPFHSKDVVMWIIRKNKLRVYNTEQRAVRVREKGDIAPRDHALFQPGELTLLHALEDRVGIFA